MPKPKVDPKSKSKADPKLDASQSQDPNISKPPTDVQYLNQNLGDLLERAKPKADQKSKSKRSNIYNPLADVQYLDKRLRDLDELCHGHLAEGLEFTDTHFRMCQDIWVQLIDLLKPDNRWLTWLSHVALLSPADNAQQAQQGATVAWSLYQRQYRLKIEELKKQLQPLSQDTAWQEQLTERLTEVLVDIRPGSDEQKGKQPAEAGPSESGPKLDEVMGKQSAEKCAELLEKMLDILQDAENDANKRLDRYNKYDLRRNAYVRASVSVIAYIVVFFFGFVIRSLSLPLVEPKPC